MSPIQTFRDTIEAFLAKSGMSPTAFGKSALGDPNFVFDLRNGRSPNLRNVERAQDFIRKSLETQSNREEMVKGEAA